METLQKNLQKILIFLAGAVLAFAGWASTTLFTASNSLGAINPINPQMTQASTTVYTITTSSQRILATSSQRVAHEVDATKCTGGAAGVYQRMALDGTATASTGNLIFASTSQAFGLTPYSAPTVTGAVTAITDAGTCTVIVTEWRNGQ